MKIKDVFKSRTVSFNALIGAAVPIWNHVAALAFPQAVIGAELANNMLVFGNLLLRFMTDGPVGKEQGK